MLNKSMQSLTSGVQWGYYISAKVRLVFEEFRCTAAQNMSEIWQTAT